MTRMILGLLLVGTSALSAQQHPLIGAWTVSYAAGIRMENGAATPMMGTGSMTIKTQGDSIVGELVANPAPDRPARPPVHFATLAAGTGELVFQSRSEATLNIGGTEQKTTAITTWKLRVRNDSLVGTMERVIEGLEMANAGPQPITGVRKQE